MENQLHQHFEEPPHKGLTSHTIVYDSSYHERTLPEGFYKYQNLTDQEWNYEETLSTTSSEVVDAIARKNVSTTLADKFSKPSFNVSIRKRYSRNNIFSKHDIGKAPKGKSRTSVVDRNKVCTLVTKKLASGASIIANTQLTCTKLNKDVSDVFKCNSHTERVVRYITHYLCKNPHLLSQLVYIITDSEDLQICLYAIKILYLLLIKGDRFDEADRTAMIAALSCPKILQTLIESMYFIDIRFVDDTKYKQELQTLHSQILQMVVVICKTNPSRQELIHASEGTVKLIGKLTSTCYKRRDLANSLLEALKIISTTKRNCKYLSSKRFFDGLCTCCNLTNKLFTTTKVLKAMSRNESALVCMSANNKIMKLMMDLIYYNGKKTINKRAVFTILYRMVKTESGVQFFSKNKMFDKLYHYLLKNEKNNHRLETIEAYTILNRVAKNVKILPSTKLNIGVYLPESVKKLMEKEKLSVESDSENDDSEDDEELETSDSDGAEISPSKDIEAEEETLAGMCPFYVEHLTTADDSDFSNIYKFDMYEGILRLSHRKVIESRVHRGKNMDKVAYPDALMLDPQYDDHTLSSSSNNFSIKKLAHKLKCLKGTHNNTHPARVVYDVEEENSKKPMGVPHPSTYSYNPLKTDDRPQTSASSLKFESRFECGNLRKAIQIGKCEYELHLSPDTNTTKGLQWFYFQVTHMTPRVPYIFNITNCLKLNSQYNCGMQPLMFSVIDHALNKTGWKRVGREIVYYGNNYINETGSKQYKTLSFCVSFPYSNDYVYFAYHYPYTYTRLMVKLFPLIKHKTNQVYARVDKLCKTVANKNEVALLTITGACDRAGSLGIPFTRRPIIFITARANPGESNTSWIMEGIIKFLLHETDKNAVIAREHFVFKIIPMLNPDGVIYGNNTCGLTGADLDRCWIRPNKITCPEIYHTKKLIACAKKILNLPIAAYIDIHGHNQKKFFFFYGCDPKMSWNKEDRASEDFSDILKLLPETVHHMNPNICLTQCKYKITKNRENTGRIVMWRDFDIKQSFTLQCSYSFANEIESINTKILTNIGASVIASLGKIADKVYMSKKAIPSLELDYSGNSDFRTNPLAPLKSKKIDYTLVTSFFNNNLEETTSDSEM